MKTTKERAFWLCASEDRRTDCGYTHRTREAAEDCHRRRLAAIRRRHGAGSWSFLAPVAGNEAARREDELSDELEGAR